MSHLRPPLLIVAISSEGNAGENNASQQLSRCVDAIAAMLVYCDSFSISRCKDHPVVRYRPAGGRPRSPEEGTCLAERNGCLSPASWIGTTPMCEKTKSSRR